MDTTAAHRNITELSAFPMPITGLVKQTQQQITACAIGNQEGSSPVYVGWNNETGEAVVVPTADVTVIAAYGTVLRNALGNNRQPQSQR
jgi:hypothetical protein